jgi:Lon protease-like protein
MSEGTVIERLPLFPLGSAAMPGGRIALRVFEARYLDLVSECLRHDSAFGICLIRSGGDAGEPALPFGTGTAVRIVDWHRGPEGLLGITAVGEYNFRIEELSVEANPLVVARVQALAPEPSEPVPAGYEALVQILAQLLRQLEGVIDYADPQWNDAAWVGGRLTELLPLGDRVRQTLLEMDNPTARLEELRQALQ